MIWLGCHKGVSIATTALRQAVTSTDGKAGGESTPRRLHYHADESSVVQ